MNNDNSPEELNQEHLQLIEHIVDELILVHKMEKFFKLKDLLSSKEDRKYINNLLSKIDRLMGGPPLIIFTPDDRNEIPEFDTYLGAAIDEIKHIYIITKKSIAIAHMIMFTTSKTKRYPNLFKKEINFMPLRGTTKYENVL